MAINFGPLNPRRYSPDPNSLDPTRPDIYGFQDAPAPTVPSLASAVAPAVPASSPTDEFQKDFMETGAKLRAALEPHPISTPRAVLGALVGNRNPMLGSVITGDYQRQRQIQPLQQQYGALANIITQNRALALEKSLEDYRTGRLEQGQERIDNPKEPAMTPEMTDIQGLMKQTNPDTKQPYTFHEARVKIAQDLQDTKPDKTQSQIAPHTVNVGTRVKQWNPTTQKYDIDVGPTPKSETPAALPPEDKTFANENAKQVTKDLTTARGADFRLRSMQGSYKDATQKNDQQAMLNLLTNHIGMTLGLQKGARITKDILHEATASTPWLQHVEAKFGNDGYLSGVVLTKTQMDQMMNLAHAQRHTAWQQAHDSAGQAGLTDKVQFPKDFVPEGEGGGTSGTTGALQVIRDANGRIIGVK